MCCLMLTVVTDLNAQSDWFYLNPTPQPNDLYALTFPTTGVGYAAGIFGTILKTNDGELT